MLAGLEARAIAGKVGETDASVRVVATSEVAAELSDLSYPNDVRALESRPSTPAARIMDLSALAFGPTGSRRQGNPVFAGLAESDVVHYPLSFISGPRHSAPSVVTCVDLQHLHHPQFFSRRDRAIRALRWHRSIRGADRVMVFSRFVRESLVDRLGIDSELIDVVGATCSPRFFEAATAPSAYAEGSDFGYLLYPASPLPAKNHRRLLAAFGRLHRTHPGIRLVLVGPAIHDWAPVRAAIAAERVEAAVEIRGHVPLNDLVSLYAGATALVFPSLFEGFGMPVLEAMAVGCPVVASTATAIPEVCGDAAIGLDPASTDSIADAIEAVLTLPGADRRRLIDAGHARASELVLERMVERQFESFRRALDTMRR